MGIVRAADDVENGVVGGDGGSEVTAPLLLRHRKEDAAAEAKIQVMEAEEAAGSCGGGKGGSLWMVLLSTAVTVCGSFEFGTCVGYSAPTQSGIVDDVGLSISEFAIFGSVLTVGAMIGAVTSGRLADFLGHKMTMRISATVCSFGWFSIHFAKGATMLYFGRILLGYSTGVLSYVVPVFIAEIAPKNLRGGLATSNQLLICSGSSVTYIIGALVAWCNLLIMLMQTLRGDQLTEGKVPIGIGENTTIQNCIIDKNRIGKNVTISNSEGCTGSRHRTSEGFHIRSGITVVLKNSVVANGLVI